jgi:hypothetical protein
MLLVFMDVSDKWKSEKLYEAVVRRLAKNGIAGATVLPGTMGYGQHRRIHRPGLFGVTAEQPIAVIAIDQEDKIRAVLPKIVPMVKGGIVTLVDAEIVSTSEQSESPGSTE